MNRRRCLQLLAVAPLAPLAVGQRPREAGTLYSVERGHSGDVYLNGRKVEYAVSCKTGCCGWVRFFVLRSDGSIDCRAGGPVMRRSRGDVVFVPYAKRFREEPSMLRTSAQNRLPSKSVDWIRRPSFRCSTGSHNRPSAQHWRDRAPAARVDRRPEDRRVGDLPAPRRRPARREWELGRKLRAQCEDWLVKWKDGLVRLLRD